MIHRVGILCSEPREKYATTEGDFVDIIHYTNTFFFPPQEAGPIKM